MRFFLAIAVLVTGFLVTAIGALDMVRNRPISEVELAVQDPLTVPYVFIPSETLAAYSSNIEISLQGENSVFLASGRDVDIRAWLGESPYVEYRVVVNQGSETASLQLVNRAGDAPTSSPVGADIWISERANTESLVVKVNAQPETGVLIASDGTSVAPSAIKLTWDIPDIRRVLLPLFEVGLAVMGFGSILLLWVLWLDWRKRGPIRLRPARAPRPLRGTRVTSASPDFRKPKARHARFVALPAALTVLVLAGCSSDIPNPTLSPTKPAVNEIIDPVMTIDQLERILEEVATSISEADATLNKELLEARVAGPALQVRTAAYNLARKSDNISAPAPISGSPIQWFLPSATEGWPRTAMLVTGELTGDPQQMLVLRQETPRSKYKLWHYQQLLPGAEFPEVASPELGATLVKPDSKLLMMDATVLPEAVGDMLNNGAESLYTQFVDGTNAYISDVSSVQRNLAETLDNADVVFSHALGDEALILHSTLEGGALVSLYMKDTYRIVPIERGDAVAISGPEAILLGSEGSVTGIETVYGAMLLFYLPPAGSDQLIRVLGASQQLLRASSIG